MKNFQCPPHFRSADHAADIISEYDSVCMEWELYASENGHHCSEIDGRLLIVYHDAKNKSSGHLGEWRMLWRIAMHRANRV